MSQSDAPRADDRDGSSVVAHSLPRVSGSRLSVQSPEREADMNLEQEDQE